MKPGRSIRRQSSIILAASIGLVFGAPVFSQDSGAPIDQHTAPPQAIAEISSDVWTRARTSHDADALVSVGSIPANDANANLAGLRASFDLLEANLAKRESARATQIAKVEEELNKTLALEHSPANLSKALKSVVELYLLAKDKDAVLHDPRTTDLIRESESAARAAESAGQWLMANEIFYRLHTLLEEKGTYKADVERLATRLSMIRLYMPEHFWKLRNDARVAEGETALPPYNGLGEDYNAKLAAISEASVVECLGRASIQHVDTRDLGVLLAGGLDAIRAMVTTEDLKGVFPGIGQKDSLATMLSFLDDRTTKVREQSFRPSRAMIQQLLEDLKAINSVSVQVPDKALLHEFGNGAMARLDDFTAIIWPDEVARFERMTQGEFKGVGIQIQFDEEALMIKVVTPLEGTPAQRAGIHMGDFIKKIDGQSAVGLSINQAVDLITGPENTPVTITVERKTGEEVDGSATMQEIEFPLKRAVIPVATVKGWKRTGAREDQWDYFIDPGNNIGYVRLLQFTDETTHELRAAVAAMQQSPGGLSALILDLRFNPGGLLNEAVSVSNLFVDHGTIVSTQGMTPSEVRTASPGNARLNRIPVAVLINEGSASASEIVSGAIRHYADKGDIRAVLVGQRSFGKGSVQNVFPVNPGNSMLKLTTQYYKLPDGRILHKRPGESVWGVDPHVLVDMLPEQVTDSIKMRQDADVLPLDEKGNIVQSATPPPDPQKLIDDGVDLQLQTALVLLQTQAAAGKPVAAQVN